MNNEENKKLPFIIGSSYMLSFIFIRLMVILAGSVKNETVVAIKEGAIPSKLYIGRNIIIYGYHIHHFYFGILLLSIAGWMAIIGNDYFSKEKLAVMYGVGLGLFMDEIGMLLSEGNYYSSLSYLLGVLLLGILINIIYFPPFWKSVRETIININIPGVKIIKTLFSYMIKSLDFISSKIIEYKLHILVILIIFFVIDFLIPYIF